MENNIIEELNIQELREKILKFTRNAYQMLPKMMKPKILDIGCGTGLPTLELVKLSDGEVIGIDIDKTSLYKLNLEIEKRRLSEKVKTIHCSLYEVNFPDQVFNVIWEEGVFHLLELNKVLTICNRLLKDKGWLIVFETISWIKDKFKLFTDHGFKLITQFLLPEYYWWTDYYLPLEKKIKELYVKYKSSELLKDLKSYEREIEMVKKNPKNFDCGFYIMQKSEIN